jgi:hypothetical protein
VQRVSRRRFTFTALAGLAFGTAGCSSGGREPQGAPPPAETPAPAPTPTPTPRLHPFNGGRRGLRNRVLAVKIDNTAPAHPQEGLRSADIVYVEQVEGGETRIMAIFCSKFPERVGPVRSARISDLHLLRQFGRPALAFSGEQSKMKPVLKKFTARWPAESLTFQWSARHKRWLTYHNGVPNAAAEGGILGGRTVVIQYVKTTRSRYHDVNGAYTPLLHTTGKGKALVLRDGMAYDCTWSRSSENEGTVFTTEQGEPMTFAPGQVWVALVNKGRPVVP